MKTVVIEYTFPDDYDSNEVVTRINGAVTDTDSEFVDELTYKIIEEVALV